MASNSKDDLLAELSKGDAMHGWGAMLSIGRDRFNQLLQDRFVEAFATQDFIVPFSGEYYADNNTEKVVFANIMFGPPQVSFRAASGRSAQVKLSMELIAGRCSMIAEYPGEPAFLRRCHVLQPGMGFRFEVTVDLQVVRSRNADKGQLVIDWSTVSDPVCNLAVTPSAESTMGAYLLRQLGPQLRNWTLPVVTIEFHFGYNAVSVVDFTVVAQKAPEGGGSGSSPADDGAVVLLMQLRGALKWGYAPAGWLYLLPSSGAGKGNYGASLLVSKAWAPLMAKFATDVLSQVVLPQKHEIAMSEEYKQHDTILFGDITPGKDARILQPALSSLGASRDKQFTLTGTAPSEWSVRNLTYPRACGDMVAGRYTASAIDKFASDSQVVLVTAKLTNSPDSEVRTALVVESSEALAISPRVVLWNKGDPALTLTASDGEGISWALEDGTTDGFEAIPEDPRSVRYTPSAKDEKEPVELLRIKVSRGADSGYATVVMIKYSMMLQLEPFHVSQMPPSGTQDFALLDYKADSWMLFGKGTLKDGVYTAPGAEPGGPGEVSVVVGVAYGLGGLAVIEHGRNSVQQMATQQERWKALNRFEVLRNNSNRNKVLANGLQQVGIDVLIETNSFEGANGTVWDPVSDQELSTLQLLYEDGSPVYVLPAGADGLDPDELPEEAADQKWAVTKRRNVRYDYFPVSAVQAEQDSLLAPIDARRTVTFFVNALEAEVRKFKAKFQDHNNGWHYSDLKEGAPGVLELQGVQVSPPNIDDYKFEPKRVYTHDGSNHSNGDFFNYWHYTTDYWVLRAPGLEFVRARLAYASMMKWESELIDETYCSYTGFAFIPRRDPDSVSPPSGITYGAELELLVHEEKVKFEGLDYGFKNHESVSTGTLLLSLDRVPNLKYWVDTEHTEYRKVLDRPLLVTLTDNYGNAHHLRITFKGGVDSRNQLVLEGQ
ncbi:hypothetical protein U8291_13380 [Pseudomonas sp. A2]|uniref:hypothetical protein n=1 Tax=Pseudomonas sp. A2 TaxID=107445 RepID=UPI002B76286D|nr:hypothetical protein [Pseudomonas sp. A2]MEB3438007.1 hypothetical protein [Pseudomonas sp. A2]